MDQDVHSSKEAVIENAAGNAYRHLFGQKPALVQTLYLCLFPAKVGGEVRDLAETVVADWIKQADDDVRRLNLELKGKDDGRLDWSLSRLSEQKRALEEAFVDLMNLSAYPRQILRYIHH